MSTYFLYIVFFFFFQAEDGIRDLTVTGVQTCALPISCCSAPSRCVGPREPDELATLGPAPERDSRARPAGRALRLSRGPRGPAPAGAVVPGGLAGAGLVVHRPGPQPLGRLPVQAPLVQASGV